MNKRVLIIVGILAAAILGAIVALALAGQDARCGTFSDSHNDTIAHRDPRAHRDPEPGRYLAYSAEELEANESRTLVFFYAPWCGQCVDIDEGILAQGVPDGVTIFKADFDTEQALEQQYGMTMRTTFIEIADDGSELQRFVAYDTPTFDPVTAAMF